MQKESLDEIHIDELLSKMLGGRSIELHLEVGKPPYVRADTRGAYKLVELKFDTWNQYEIACRAVLQRMIYDLLTDAQIVELESEGVLVFSYLEATGGDRFDVHVIQRAGNIKATFHPAPSGGGDVGVSRAFGPLQ